MLKAAETLYGFRWWALLLVALRTGGRRGDLLGLTWDRTDFDGQKIHFANTKGKRDRLIPVKSAVLDVLRRLQAQTLLVGGPFVGMDKAMQRRWDKIVRVAGVKAITLHDSRRTFITRLIRAGIPLPTVQKPAGHSDIKTTLVFYNWTSEQDLLNGIDRLADTACFLLPSCYRVPSSRPKPRF